MKLDSNLYEMLVVFRELATTKNMTKVSEQLKVPKSKVSRSLNQLEESLSLKLVSRTTRQMELTDEGRKLMDNVIPLISQIETNIEQTQSQKAQMRGSISVTAPEDIGIELMGKICSEFNSLYPDVQLELVISNQVFDLVKENIDIAIRIGKVGSLRSLYVQKIGMIRMVGVCSQRWSINKDSLTEINKKNYSQNYTDFVLRDQNGLPIPFLRFGKKKNLCKLELNFKGAQKLLLLKPQFFTNSFFSLREMVRNHHGWSILPHFLIENDLAQKKLVEIFPEVEMDSEEVFLVNTAGKSLSPRARVFWDFLKSKLIQFRE